jgi:sugar phosphate isomerase/epimerase
MHPIYFASILLERNRWASRVPSYNVSDWIARFREEGFDGIELWENHALKASDEELEAIRDTGFPVAVFNSYVGFGESDEEREHRRHAARLIEFFHAPAVKFNVGKNPSELPGEIERLREWAAMLPASCRLLCECHPGTSLETPEAAEKALESLPAERFEALVHAPVEPAKLQEWFDALGSRIAHVHLQARGEDKRLLRLDSDRQQMRANVEVLRSNGFAGSFSIEFTEGVRAPIESPEELYRNAAAMLLASFISEQGAGGLHGERSLQRQIFG